MVQVVGLEICSHGIGNIVCGCIKHGMRASGIYLLDYQPLASIYFHFYAKT